MKSSKILFFVGLVVVFGISFVAINQAYKPSSAASISCIDSDNGLNYDVYGYVTYRGSIYNDACSTSSRLLERYCNKNRAASKDYFCPYGCSDGACNQPCSPSSCSSLGKQCGSWSDGCDGTLE